MRCDTGADSTFSEWIKWGCVSGGDHQLPRVRRRPEDDRVCSGVWIPRRDGGDTLYSGVSERATAGGEV